MKCLIKRVACIQDVGCVHPGFATYLARIRSQKSVACIRQNGLSGCAHWCPKRPLRASVSEMTLACIHFQVTKNQHSDLNIVNFGFTTGFLQQRMALTATSLGFRLHKECFRSIVYPLIRRGLDNGTLLLLSFCFYYRVKPQ